jgi:hypothetical protein
MFFSFSVFRLSYYVFILNTKYENTTLFYRNSTATTIVPRRDSQPALAVQVAPTAAHFDHEQPWRQITTALPVLMENNLKGAVI